MREKLRRRDFFSAAVQKWTSNSDTDFSINFETSIKVLFASERLTATNVTILVSSSCKLLENLPREIIVDFSSLVSGKFKRSFNILILLRVSLIITVITVNLYSAFL